MQQQGISQDMSQLPFEQLFQLGETKFNQMDYEQAQYYYSLAYNKKPHDDMIVLCYANILKHNDKPNQAKKLLQKSLKNNPNGTYKRYFELAQIQQGEKSIQIFQQGIAVASKSFSNPFLSTAPQPQIKRDIAQAYASIAEVCMTDLSNIPFQKVQAKCAEVLQKGKEIDPTCMDVHMQIANCCIEKDQYDIARNELLIVKTAVLQQKQQFQDQLVMQCAKLFMEISDFQHSIDVLQKLNQSQNNNPETVYLLAYCAFQLGQYSLCKDYILNYPEGQMIDQQVEQAMKQLKQELSKKQKKGGEQTEQGCGEQQQWVDMDDDGMQQN